jgi:peptidoglycan/LPS O-acetylase OafA/YrhL
VHKDLLLKTVLYLTFFANVVLANVGLVPYASHTWSVGTEEQFYLMWPLLIQWTRRTVSLMLTIIITYVTVRFLIQSGIVVTGALQAGIRGFLSLFNVDCMAIGGLAAVALHRRAPVLRLLVNLPVFFASLLILLVSIAKSLSIPYLEYEFYAMLFALLVLNFSTHPRLGHSLEFQPIHYLGKISYGLYLLHPIAIVASIRLFAGIGWVNDTLFYPTCFLITIGLSALSYRFLESPFLRLKSRFASMPKSGVARDSVAAGGSA